MKIGNITLLFVITFFQYFNLNNTQPVFQKVVPKYNPLRGAKAPVPPRPNISALKKDLNNYIAFKRQEEDLSHFKIDRNNNRDVKYIRKDLIFTNSPYNITSCDEIIIAKVFFSDKANNVTDVFKVLVLSNYSIEIFNSLDANTLYSFQKINEVKVDALSTKKHEFVFPGTNKKKVAQCIDIPNMNSKYTQQICKKYTYQTKELIKIIKFFQKCFKTKDFKPKKLSSNFERFIPANMIISKPPFLITNCYQYILTPSTHIIDPKLQELSKKEKKFFNLNFGSFGIYKQDNPNTLEDFLELGMADFRSAGVVQNSNCVYIKQKNSGRTINTCMENVVEAQNVLKSIHFLEKCRLNGMSFTYDFTSEDCIKRKMILLRKYRETTSNMLRK